MARPSSNTDEKLVKAGVKLFRKKGISGLVLREVADKAGVNLGMFNYHYKNKEEFSKAVLKVFYEDFFVNFERCLQAAIQNPTRIEHYEEALLKVGTYILSQVETFSLLVKDILNGEKIVLDFALTHGYRHVLLMVNLIMECQKNNVIRSDVSPQQILIMVATNMGITSAVGHRLYSVVPGSAKNLIQEQILSIEQIQSRLKILIKGLQP